MALDPTCAPAYEPTFSNVFQKTLQPSCAYAGPSCHASSGRKAGVVFDDPESAYRSLLEGERTVPGKPECSLLVRKLQSNDTSFMMPPGLALPPDERCAVIQWIARGALR